MNTWQFWRWFGHPVDDFGVEIFTYQSIFKGLDQRLYFLAPTYYYKLLEANK